MIYGSICSGIEAATVAWHPLGWKPAFFSEIDKFPRTVLGHHYPETQIHGDFTTIGAEDYGAIDLLVGGTPCQDFSVAGLRKGITGERGNLTLEFIRLVERKKPRWLVWENVPGVLSIDGGRTFGTFLGGLAECGYGFAYRILDAQYFGVPQRRRRVFVVGYLGDWRPASAVLFERESLRGDITPRREAREGIARTLKARADSSWTPDGFGNDIVAGCLQERDAKGADSDTKPGHLIPCIPIVEASGRVNNAVPINTQLGLRGPDTSNSVREGIGIGEAGDPMFTLQAAHQHAVAFAQNQLGELRTGDVFNTINQNSNASGRNTPLLKQAMQVRRLTPRECERLQGFPDDYTLVPYRGKPATDGNRYKALGNSMAVPVMRWLGERIQKIEDLKNGRT